MSKRLKTITSLVNKCKVFADVGCDHGYVAEEILKTDKADKVIISDISKPSLQKAVNLLKPYGERVKAVVCDGFSGYDGESDFAVISGMGGEEICDIISKSKFPPKSLVLSPQKNSDKVRKLLVNLGYFIYKDFTVKDGKFYDIIYAEKTGKESFYTEKEYLFGKDNLKERTTEFLEKLQNEEKLLISVINSGAKEVLKEKTERLELIREIIYENK